MKTLILGGVRSGKSRLAETLADGSGLAVTYVATATAGDVEMQRRIAEHRRRRPAGWKVVEEPIHLARTLRDHAGDGRCLLLDCLTLWLSNLLVQGDDARWRDEREALLQVLPDLPGSLLMVSNETGLGVVPMGELSRRFCDEAGWLHQDLARICDRVVLTVAGLPHILKGDPP